MAQKTNDFGPLIARFDVRAFRFIANFSAVEPTRYYLEGVHIEPVAAELGGGVVLVATNGHRLGAYWDANGKASRPVTVATPNHTGFAQTAHRWRDGDIAMHEGLGIDARVFTAHHRGSASVDDVCLGAENEGSGRFPNWRRIVPWSLMDAQGGTRAEFNWRVLEPFAAAFDDDGVDECDGSAIPAARIPQIFGDDLTETQLVLRDDVPDFIGVAMPVGRPKLRPDGRSLGQLRTKQVERLRKLAPAPEAAS